MASNQIQLAKLTKRNDCDWFTHAFILYTWPFLPAKIKHHSNRVNGICHWFSHAITSYNWLCRNDALFWRTKGVKCILVCMTENTKNFRFSAFYNSLGVEFPFCCIFSFKLHKSLELLASAQERRKSSGWSTVVLSWRQPHKCSTASSGRTIYVLEFTRCRHSKEYFFSKFLQINVLTNYQGLNRFDQKKTEMFTPKIFLFFFKSFNQFFHYSHYKL